MLPYGRQTIEDDDIQAVIDALKGQYLTTGPAVNAFEKKLCEITGAKYAVACSNGTTALHLACMAIDLKEDECAIVPTLTFLATANAARYCGANIVFSDVHPDTGLMTSETLLDAISYANSKGWKVRVVLPVHLAGQAVDLEPIKVICTNNNIKIISDACHAIGGMYKKSPIGSCQFEDLSTFSFHPVKTIAMGEGGAVTTNNQQYAEKMKRLRHHGMEKTEKMEQWAYEMHDLGYNYRVTDIQCALGISQLKKLNRFVKQRQDIVSTYNNHLQGISEHVHPPKQVNSETTGWHLYAIKIDFEKLNISRSSLMSALQNQGIGTQVHYIPVHLQPYYRKLYGTRDLPGAQSYYEKTLSLPLYPGMSKDDANKVIKVLKENICNEK